MDPKAKPRFEGAFLSATRLSNRGCTRPNPMPFSTRPTKIISKDQATAQTANPEAQKIIPAPMSNGLGKSSPMKPQGKAKRAAETPFAVDNQLSEVWETW